MLDINNQKHDLSSHIMKKDPPRVADLSSRLSEFVSKYDPSGYVTLVFACPFWNSSPLDPVKFKLKLEVSDEVVAEPEESKLEKSEMLYDSVVNAKDYLDTLVRIKAKESDAGFGIRREGQQELKDESSVIKVGGWLVGIGGVVDRFI